MATLVVLGSGELVLKGKRSEEATDFDAGIRWDVTSASGEEPTTENEPPSGVGRRSRYMYGLGLVARSTR